MTGLIDWLTVQLAANPLAVAAVVAALAMAEGVIVVGIFVPGITIVLAIAAAAGAAGEGLWVVFVATALGAILGDVISFWVGWRHGMAIASWGPLKRQPGAFDKARVWFGDRGAMSVAVSRFVPAVRTVVPTFAGIARMSPVAFMVANALSGVVWAAAHVYGAGLAGGLLSAIGGRLGAVLVGALVLLGAALWLARIAALASVRGIRRVRVRLLERLAARDDRASRLAAQALAPEDLSGLLVVLWGGVLVAGAVLFSGLAEAVAEHEEVEAADLAISRAVQSLRTPGMDEVMLAVTLLGEGVVIAAVALTTAVWLLWRGARRAAVVFGAVILLSSSFVLVTKTLLQRTRPLPDLYEGASAFAFPSGHTTNSAVLAGLLAVLIAGSLRRHRRWAAAAILAPALAIAASRIWLGAHWPTDVAAGLAFAAAATAGFALVVGRRPGGIGPLGLAAAAGGAFALVGAGNVVLTRDEARPAYAARDLSVPMTEEEWREGGWRAAGVGTVGFDGEVEVPFALQWAGEPEALGAALKAAGWHKAPRWNLPALRGVVMGDTPSEALPPAPKMHLGRLPQAVWTHPAGPDARLVLRLWSSPFTVDGAPLRVAALEREAMHRPLGLMTVPEDRPAGPAAREALRNAAAAHPATRHVALHLRPASSAEDD